jgi:hypothetical protein
MQMSRKAEYRADAFAASLGFKADMIQALEIMDGITVADNSFQGKLMATHPAPMLRIGALEDGQVQEQRLVSLRMATPFADSKSVSITAHSEVIRLTSILVIVGALWCGYQVFNHHASTRNKKLNLQNIQAMTSELTKVESNPAIAKTTTKRAKNK